VEQDIDFSASTEEQEYEVAVERVIRWLKNVEQRPSKRSEFLKEISPLCVMTVCVSPSNLMRFFEDKNLINADNKKEMLFNHKKIKSFNVEKSMQSSSLPEKEKNDMCLVLEKVLCWMDANTSLPTNYYQFSHALTKFCEVTHVQDAELILQEFINEGFIAATEPNPVQQTDKRDQEGHITSSNRGSNDLTLTYTKKLEDMVRAKAEKPKLSPEELRKRNVRRFLVVLFMVLFMAIVPYAAKFFDPNLGEL